jgi:hypothetical protein
MSSRCENEICFWAGDPKRACFLTFSLCACCRQYPGVADGRNLRSTRPAISTFPDMAGLLGVHSSKRTMCRPTRLVAACTLALSPICDTLIECFSHFVTSVTAPITSGWSGCRVGLAPTGKRRLVTAHAKRRHSISDASLNRAAALIFCNLSLAASRRNISLRFLTLAVTAPAHHHWCQFFIAARW